MLQMEGSHEEIGFRRAAELEGLVTCAWEIPVASSLFQVILRSTPFQLKECKALVLGNNKPSLATIRNSLLQ